MKNRILIKSLLNFGKKIIQFVLLLFYRPIVPLNQRTYKTDFDSSQRNFLYFSYLMLPFIYFLSFR